MISRRPAAQKSKSSLSSPLKLSVFAKVEEDVIDWALDYGYLMVRFNISRSAVEMCFGPAHHFDTARKLLLEESEESEEDRIAFENVLKSITLSS
jgi:NADH:ubiquinone oxidoreductase subunit B-like Fe-S oxidoreductase